ncbi:MAG: SBBP repeat-containing protein [Deltaproteobacteria bacterium]|nr:SBBP repeat-containing protein [Deltaproteobacteria bacterium]
MVIFILLLVSFSTQASPSHNRPISTDALQSLIMGFIPNYGQVGKEYPFYTLGLQHSTFFSKHGVLYSAKVEQTFVGANSNPMLIPALPKKGFINHYRGKDPSRWQSKLPLFDLLTYRNLYPGIDLIFKFKGNQLESEFVVNPKANYKKIIMAYYGLNKLKLNQDGSLTLKTNAFSLTENKPYVYQIVQGEKREIRGQFKILADKRVTFDLAPFDKQYPVVIDPAMTYSTYLGGDDLDIAYAMAIDADGNIFVAGGTNSSDFPTQSAEQASLSAVTDAFIVKFNSGGTTLAYATYLGGDATDIATDLALDSAGSAYITGFTTSSDYPTSNSTGFSSADISLGGTTDALVTKLNTDGTVEFSSYVGGSDDEFGFDIAVDVDGGFYIVGQTESSDLLDLFENSTPVQASLSGSSDAFVYAFLPTKTLSFAT